MLPSKQSLPDPAGQMHMLPLTETVATCKGPAQVQPRYGHRGKVDMMFISQPKDYFQLELLTKE